MFARFGERSDTMAATTAPAQHLAVLVPVDLQCTHGIVSLVDTLLTDMPRPIAHEIASAVQEAFAHVVEHSGLTEQEVVEVHAERTSRGIVIELIDAGVPYDSDFLSPYRGDTEWDLPVQQLRELLILRCVDGASYKRTNRNVLRLVKRLATSNTER